MVTGPVVGLVVGPATGGHLGLLVGCGTLSLWFLGLVIGMIAVVVFLLV